ncbi:MAG: protein-L-isoaspartate O-methyltransferase [Pseudomonadota bacterium]
MSDFALSRLNMVESQIRPSDVTDRRISRTMLALPREEFVPAPLKPICYMDQDLILPPSRGSDRRFLLAPRALAKLIQALEVNDDSVVLDLGCATGYSAAVLSRLAGTVFAVESDPALAETASKLLERLEISNVQVTTGPLGSGLPKDGPFDAILINGTVGHVPAELLDQLKDSARLVAVLTGDGVGHATRWLRVGSRYTQAALFDASAPALSEFAEETGFVF